jgi:hypothetical protein
LDTLLFQELAGLAGDTSFLKLEARYNQCGSLFRSVVDCGVFFVLLD